MTDKKEIERIKDHENISPFDPNWTSHVYTKDGKHIEGDGFTKEKAREAAMDVYNANKNKK
jgi:hypothetical protein